MAVNLWINADTQVLVGNMRFLRYITILILLSSPATFAGEPTYENAFSPDQGATQLVVSTIEKAQQTIRVAAYTFTSRPIADALIEAKNRGVDVKVVLDKRQSHGRGNLFDYLSENSIETRKDGHYAIMHDKFIIIDKDVLELGSFNYTKAAEEKNAENVLVVRDVPAVIKNYAAEWDKLWQESE